MRVAALGGGELGLAGGRLRFVGALILSGVFVVLLLAGIYWLSNAFLRRIGTKTLGEQAPANRRLFCLTMGAGLVKAAFEIWAFSTHHAAVGVAALVAFFVLPEFVLIPVRINRSRRATSPRLPLRAERGHAHEAASHQAALGGRLLPAT